MTTNLKIQYPEIPYQAQSFTYNLYSSLGSNTQELVSGPRYRCFSLTQSTYSDLWLNMDMGSGQSATASILSVLRAKLLKESGVNVLQLIASDQSAFMPNTISGLSYWWDATRECTTDSNELVSQLSDLSGNNKHLTQSTTSDRPQITRSDNLENWLKYSYDWSNAAHLKQSTTVTGAVVYDSNGRLLGNKVTASAASSRHRAYQVGPATRPAGVSYTYSVEVKKSNYRYLWIGDAAFSSWHGVCFDFDTATLGTQSNLTSATVETLSNSWYKITISYTASSSANPSVSVYFNTSNATVSPQSFLAAGTEEFYASHCSLRSTTASSTYLQTYATVQRKGINGSRALYFDGSNDNLIVSSVTSHTELGGSATLFFVFTIPTDTTGTNYELADCETYTASGWLVRLQPQIGGGLKPTIRTSQAGAYTQVISSNTPITRDATYVLTILKSGTTGTIYVDGTSVGSGTLDNAVATSTDVKIGGRSQPFTGKIAEIIFYNSALGTTDRQSIESYLATKYQITPTVNETNFDSEELVGPKEEDYVASFTTTSAVRYYWLHLSSTKINSYDFSKIYLGNGFDFGRDPVWGRRTELDSDDKGSRAPRYKYAFEYEDITDSVVQSFITNVVSKADVSPVVLVTGTYHEVLNDDRAVHCKIKEFSYSPVAYNQNNVSLVLEELI